MHRVIAQLPKAFRRLLPELEEVEIPEESLANCASCHMVPSGGTCTTSPWQFGEDLRCCTFHPALPNFLVGRALERGDAGSERMRTRLGQSEGVGADGVSPSAERDQRQRDLAPGEFGRVSELVCPYYVAETHGCGIWMDRGAVCRSWHCRYVDGPRGRKFWETLMFLLDHAERVLARWCTAQGGAPDEAASLEAWEAWYRLCAARIEEVPGEALDALRDADLERLGDDLLEAADQRQTPLPDVLTPHVRDISDEGSGVRLTGYWPYDSRHLPRTVFLLLAALDGERSWREAAARVEAESGVRFAQEDVEDLYRAGIIDVESAAAHLSPDSWRMSARVDGEELEAKGGKRER